MLYLELLGLTLGFAGVCASLVASNFWQHSFDGQQNRLIRGLSRLFHLTLPVWLGPVLLLIGILISISRP